MYDIAKPIFDKHFAGIRHPIWFGNGLSFEQQTYERGKPMPYLKAAIELLHAIGGREVVEIGTMRQHLNHPIDQMVPVCCNDGHSTAHFAAAGLHVTSVDVDEKAISIAREFTPDAICMDGIEYLRGRTTPIDLLLLDAWDPSEDNESPAKHAACLSLAAMAPTSIILIDDTDVYYGGKGRLAIPEALRMGWELLLIGRMTLLGRTAHA